MGSSTKLRQPLLGDKISILIVGFFLMGIAGLFVVIIIYGTYLDIKPFFWQRTRCAKAIGHHQ